MIFGIETDEEDAKLDAILIRQALTKQAIEYEKLSENAEVFGDASFSAICHSRAIRLLQMAESSIPIDIDIGFTKKAVIKSVLANTKPLSDDEVLSDIEISQAVASSNWNNETSNPPKILIVLDPEGD